MTSNNINISSGGKKFTYYFEYFDDKEYVKDTTQYIVNDGRIIFINGNYHNILYKRNYWEESDMQPVKDYIPQYVNLSSIDVYFPSHSLEVYERGVKYALTIKIYISGVEVILGSFLVDRIDAVAGNSPIRMLGQDYYEKINITIPDPYYILYSDDWKEWRCKNIYGYDKTGEDNDEASNIIIQFYPVEQNGDNYLKRTECGGGQNVLEFHKNTQKYLELKFGHNFYKSNNDPKLIAKFVFNPEYSNFGEYLTETYGINDYRVRIEIAMKDDDNIYKYLTATGLDSQYEFPVSELEIYSNEEYLDGMVLQAIATIEKMNDGSYKDSLQIISNDIEITPEVFKFLISDKSIYNINLDLLHNMINYNCNIVNKIQKNIIKIDKPNDYKSNIIKPVFFRTQEISELQIHGQITENIVLNLDAYKNKVEIFYLNIQGVLFQEIGRVNSGVIFKVIGGKLDKDNKSGNYYILDQDQEMVTYGKYKLL